MPGTTRTMAPASLISIAGAAAGAIVAVETDPVMIGTKHGEIASVDLEGCVVALRCAAPRQPNTCCEQICQRRATSATRAPGSSVSATIRAFWSSDQRRRRPGPVRTSTRRYASFASSLTSNITIARSPLPQPNQALPGRGLNKGVGTKLTIDPERQHVFRVLGPPPGAGELQALLRHISMRAFDFS